MIQTDVMQGWVNRAFQLLILCWSTLCDRSLISNAGQDIDVADSLCYIYICMRMFLAMVKYFESFCSWTQGITRSSDWNMQSSMLSLLSWLLTWPGCLPSKLALILSFLPLRLSIGKFSNLSCLSAESFCGCLQTVCEYWSANSANRSASSSETAMLPEVW